RVPLAAIGAAGALVLLGVVLVVTQSNELLERWRHFSYFSRGLLVPLFALYLAWDARAELRAARPEWCRVGVLLAVAGLVLLITGTGVRSITIVALALPLLIGGTAALLLGRARARALAFPIGFLALMAPFPRAVLPTISLALQTASASVGSAI